MIDQDKLLELLNINYAYLQAIQKEVENEKKLNVALERALEDSIKTYSDNIAALQIHQLQHKLFNINEQTELQTIAYLIKLPLVITNFENSLSSKGINIGKQHFENYTAYLESTSVDKSQTQTVLNKEKIFEKLGRKLQGSVRKNDLDFF